MTFEIAGFAKCQRTAIANARRVVKTGIRYREVESMSGWSVSNSDFLMLYISQAGNNARPRIDISIMHRGEVTDLHWLCASRAIRDRGCMNHFRVMRPRGRGTKVARRTMIRANHDEGMSRT